jgi:hypothetical protein
LPRDQGTISTQSQERCFELGGAFEDRRQIRETAQHENADVGSVNIL